jgi:hypothetical protein
MIIILRKITVLCLLWQELPAAMLGVVGAVHLQYGSSRYVFGISAHSELQAE